MSENLLYAIGYSVVVYLIGSLIPLQAFYLACDEEAREDKTMMRRAFLLITLFWVPLVFIWLVGAYKADQQGDGE